MRDNVPSVRYSSVCNVLRQWSISLIPTYRVYRLYDYGYINIHRGLAALHDKCGAHLGSPQLMNQDEKCGTAMKRDIGPPAKWGPRFPALYRYGLGTPKLP